jgi:hypothetical protein
MFFDLSNGRFSSNFRQSVVLIGSLFVVGLLTLGLVANIGQSTFWLGGKHITLNPSFSTLLVDFFFVIFSAGLAQYADPKRDESHSTRFSTRAACMACFMVSAATLAPMASYVATIWRKLAGGAEYQATIVSLLICNAYPESCHHIYFYLGVLLAGTSLVIAFWAAAILRRIEVEETGSHGTWVMRGAFPLGVSVLLFSATTLFHQGWDLGISENNPVGEIFYLILIVVWLAAALFFSALALFAANAIGRVTRRVLRHFGRWLLVGLSFLASITLFAAKAIGRVTRRVLRHLGRWLLVGLSFLASITLLAAKAVGRVTGRVLGQISLGRWLLVGLSTLAAIAAWNFANLIDEHIRQWMRLFGYFIIYWLLVVGIIYAVAWGLPRFFRLGAPVLSELGRRMILYWPERAISFRFLEWLVEPGIAYLRGASTRGLRWITGSGGRFWKGVRGIIGGEARRSDGRETRGGGASTTNETSRGHGTPVTMGVVVRGAPMPSEPWSTWKRGVQFVWAHFVSFFSALVAATRALSQWLSRASQFVWAQCVKFARALVAATRALGQRISPISPKFKWMVLLLGLLTVPYSVVPPVIPQTQEVPSEPEQLPQKPKAPISLKKPFLFTQAKLVCPNHKFLAWTYYDVELHFSITSCSFTEGSLDPCKAKAIVVVGRASTGGAEEVESQRSLDRGSLLAHMLKRDLLQRCENGVGMRWFVLNVGQYAGQTLKGRQVAQREVSVFIADGDADLDEIANALEQFVETQPILSEYTRCDLYMLDQLPSKSSLVRRLRCGRSAK